MMVKSYALLMSDSKSSASTRETSRIEFAIVAVGATVGLAVAAAAVAVGTGVGGTGVSTGAVGAIRVAVETVVGSFVGTIAIAVGTASDVHAIANTALIAATAPIADRRMGFREIRIIRSLSIIEPLYPHTNAGKVMFANLPRIFNGVPILYRRETPHTFAGNSIDRGDALRRDETKINDLMRSASARVLILAGLDPLISIVDDSSAKLGWLSYESAQGIVDVEPKHTTLLGVNSDGDPLVAWSLNGGARQGSDDISNAKTAELGLEICDARESAVLISGEETGIIAQARANLGWHATHGYCARCGEATAMRRGGLMRQCAACKAEHFPRTDPVVITVVTNGDRCLLGQSAGRLSAMRMYSALAGFMDQGESMEEAVRREVMEEAGIRVGRVQYHSTQPWPFPSSLMIGSHSEALTTDIDIDDFEMTDVRWWNREEVCLALAEKNEQLRVPGPIAIAHHLIKAWATGQAGYFRTS